MLLVRCGQVPAALTDRLAVDLSRFVDQVLPPEISRPMVSITTVADPVIDDEYSHEWNDAFENLLRGIPRSTITILVTGQGLWYTHPRSRFIFIHSYDDMAVLLSIRRFRSPDRVAMLSRLSKEVIKALGMALNVRPCPDERCIMSHHLVPEDLDRNTGVCPSCRERITTSLIDRAQSKQGAEGI
ncbi:MAG: hypothetical protein ABFC38_00400 [Methanospirillum sp.]